MAPATPPSETPADPCLAYIMLVLSTCEALKPNYHTVAAKAGVCDANTAQKKFKKFVEQAGYSLVKGAIIGPDGIPAAAANATPKKASPGKKAGPKGGAKAKAANSNKKRKVEELEEEKAKEEVKEGDELGAAPVTEPAAEAADAADAAE